MLRDARLTGVVTIFISLGPLQHTLVGGGPLWYGEANSVQQAYLAVRQWENAPAQQKLLGIVAGTLLFQQFTTVVVLDEQMSQDERITHIITISPTIWNDKGIF